MADINICKPPKKHKHKARKPGYKPGEKTDAELDEIEKSTLDLLISQFPLCFSRDDKRPLKVCIDLDIMAAVRLDRRALKLTLSRYVSDPTYKALMIEGVARVDLMGCPTRPVTAAQQASAEGRVIEIPPEPLRAACEPEPMVAEIAPSGRPVLRLRRTA